MSDGNWNFQNPVLRRTLTDHQNLGHGRRLAESGPENERVEGQPSSTAERSAESWRVSRTMVNFWLDVSLLVVLTALGVTGVIVQFVFPPGVAARGWKLFGMTYGQWCSIQFSLLSLLGTGVLVHVMLHWSWVCGVVARRILRVRDMPDDGIRTVYGVGLLIVLLLCAATCVGAAVLLIEEPGQNSGR